MSEHENRSVSEAQRAAYVGFLHRHPFATEAYELGFAPGVREDYRYQTEAYPNVELPVVVLDNDFQDPDVARYLGAFAEHDPSVAIIGDVYTSWEAHQYQTIIDDLEDRYPYKEYVVAPKCKSAFEQLDTSVTLGMPLGYSEEGWREFSDLGDWRGQDIHLLGGSPHTQYAVIKQLTQPTITADPPANIVGMDWNGPHKGALMGEYWTPNGWQPADHMSIRETVSESLRKIKEFWQDRGVWPETEPIELYGPAVQEPDDLVYMDRGGDPIPGREGLERAHVGRYEEKETLAFADESAKRFIEYRENLTPV